MWLWNVDAGEVHNIL